MFCSSVWLASCEINSNQKVCPQAHSGTTLQSTYNTLLARLSRTLAIALGLFVVRKINGFRDDGVHRGQQPSMVSLCLSVSLLPHLSWPVPEVFFFSSKDTLFVSSWEMSWHAYHGHLFDILSRRVPIPFQKVESGPNFPILWSNSLNDRTTPSPVFAAATSKMSQQLRYHPGKLKPGKDGWLYYDGVRLAHDVETFLKNADVVVPPWISDDTPAYTVPPFPLLSPSMLPLLNIIRIPSIAPRRRRKGGQVQTRPSLKLPFLLEKVSRDQR